MSPGDPPAGGRSTTGAKSRPWGILTGLSLLTAGFIAYAIAPASILPLLAAEYAIDKVAAGASITVVFAAWAILQLPAGYLMDRYDNRHLLIGGSVIFLSSSLAGLATPSFAAFMVTRLISGAAVVFIFVASITILNQVLPPNRRALGVSIYVASPPLGVAISLFAGPLIALPFGWRAAVLTYTLLGLVGLVVSSALLRTPITADERVTFEKFLATIRNPSILLVALAGFSSFSIWIFLTSWMPTYGTEVIGVDLAAAGAASALVPVAGILSRPAGGWISHRLGGRVRPVVVASFLASIGLLGVLSQAPSPLAFALLLALAGASVNLAVGLYFVSINTLADAATQATSVSLLTTFTTTANLIGPVLGGWLIQRFSWTVAFSVVVGLGTVGLLAILAVPLDGG